MHRLALRSVPKSLRSGTYELVIDFLFHLFDIFYFKIYFDGFDRPQNHCACLINFFGLTITWRFIKCMFNQLVISMIKSFNDVT